MIWYHYGNMFDLCLRRFYIIASGIDHRKWSSAIYSNILLVLGSDILYDTKFWREKILANLANYKRFTKIFLSKIFSFEWLEASLEAYVKQCG